MFAYHKKGLYVNVLVFIMILGISVFVSPRFLEAARAPLEEELGGAPEQGEPSALEGTLFGKTTPTLGKEEEEEQVLIVRSSPQAVVYPAATPLVVGDESKDLTGGMLLSIQSSEGVQSDEGKGEDEDPKVDPGDDPDPIPIKVDPGDDPIPIPIIDDPIPIRDLDSP